MVRKKNSAPSKNLKELEESIRTGLYLSSVKDKGKGKVSELGDMEIDKCLLSPEQSTKELIECSRSKQKSTGSSTEKTANESNSKKILDCSSEKVNTVIPIKLNSEDVIKITEDDIVDEICYWQTSVVAYILGVTPRWREFEGFCRRIWGNINIDKVIPVKQGVFVIRFLNHEIKEKALAQTNLLFDQKPLFLKQWKDGETFDAEFNTMPVWISLPNLPLRYWGVNCLKKLVSSMGTPVRPDLATAQKERISYAKYLVEMDINKEPPTSFKFINEKGVMQQQAVEVEWWPYCCTNCGKWGHADLHCDEELDIEA